MRTRLYLDSRKGSGPYPLCLVISRRGQSAYINLGVYLTADQWDAKSRRIAELPPKRWPQRDMIRNAIDRKRTEIETALLTMEADGRLHGLTALQVRDAVLRHIGGADDEGPVLFLDYFARVAETHAGRTRHLYEVTMRRIRALMPGADTLTLDDITLSWLTEFDNRMKPTAPAVNARNAHLRNIRRVMNCAIDDELTTNYPFRKFKLKTAETDKRSLTLDQVRSYLTAEVSGELSEYRDVFEVILYLLGINFIDLALLPADAIKGGRLEYVRHKTKKRYSVKIEPEARELIDRYRGERFLLDIAERGDPYVYLRRLDAGLKKILPGYPFDQLTTYWARHSVATLMINELDIPKETVSAALGHSMGSRITAVYIDFDRKKVDAANRRLIDLIKQRAPDYEHEAEGSHGSPRVTTSQR